MRGACMGGLRRRLYLPYTEATPFRRSRMRCGRCEFDNPLSSRFCGGCGASLSLVCSGCGNTNPAGFKFCGDCGHPLGGSPAAGSNVERRHLTVMFCDLVNSTQLSESVDPEEYLSIIRAYQDAVAQIVQRWDGYIAQFLGDGVLVYFGFRKAREDDAVRAVRAGLEVITAMLALSEDLERRHGTRVRARIGVHTGTVVSGSVGVGERADQLALGSTPNVAARVQSLASPDEVLITAATFEIVQRHLRAEAAGSHMLKGVAEPVEVYLVRGVRGADDERAQTPFVGRDNELAVLLDSFARAESGGGQLVVVRGEPGIGKSRLLAEFKRRVSDSAQWLVARCSSYHENVDLYPLAEMLKGRIGLSDGSSDAERFEELKRWLQSQDMVADDARYFAALLGLIAGRGVSRDEAYQTLLRWMRQASAGAPLVFSVEDAHWADPSTLDLVAAAAHGLMGSRVLVIINARPYFEPHWPAQNHHRSVEVARIGEADARLFIESCLDGEAAPAVVRQLLERADGVPLYLEELSLSVKRQVRERIDLEHLVPRSLQDSLLARIDALGPAKEIAQIGALLGRSFNLRMLQAAGRFGDVELEDGVQRVVDSGLLQRLGSGRNASLRFRHSLVQDTAYETLLKSRRKALHAQVADAIEQRFPDLAEQEPQTLARHYEGAGRIEAAIHAYIKAAARANHRAALVESVRLYRRAQGLLYELPEGKARDDIERELLFGLAQPISGQGGYGDKELRPIMDRLTALTADRANDADQYPALSTTFAFHSMRGHPHESRRAAAACFDCAARSGKTSLLIHAGFAVGSTHFYCGELQQAHEHLAESLALIERDGPFGQSRRDLDGGPLLCRIVMSWCLSLRGFPDQASRLIEDTLRIAREHEAAFAHAQALAWALYCDWDMRRSPAAIEARAQELVQVARQHDMSRWHRFAENTRNWARYLAGDDSAGDVEATREMFAPEIAAVTSGYNLCRVVDVLLARGDLRTGAEFLERCGVLARSNLGCGHAPELERQRGWLASLRGDSAEAVGHFEQALALSRANGARTQEMRAMVDFFTYEPAAAAPHMGAFKQLYLGYEEGRGEPLLQQAKALVEVVDR